MDTTAIPHTYRYPCTYHVMTAVLFPFIVKLIDNVHYKNKTTTKQKKPLYMRQIYYVSWTHLWKRQVLLLLMRERTCLMCKQATQALIIKIIEHMIVILPNLLFFYYLLVYLLSNNGTVQKWIWLALPFHKIRQTGSQGLRLRFSF